MEVGFCSYFTDRSIFYRKCSLSVAVWHNFLGGANYRIGAPGVFVIFWRPPSSSENVYCKSDRLKITPGIFKLNGFYLYENGGNGNLISRSLSFEKSKFSEPGGGTMVCADGKFLNFHLLICLKTPRFIPI